METIEEKVLNLWKAGTPIEKIEEQLKVVIEVEDDCKLNESMCQGRFIVKNILFS